MFSRICRSALLPFLLLGACLVSPNASADSAIYGDGPLYNGGQAVMDDLRASGSPPLSFFRPATHEHGDLLYNDDLIVSNGVYVGDPGWPARVASLKQAPTSVNRIEFSIGGWGVGDFDNIRT